MIQVQCPLCLSNNTIHFFQEPKPRALPSTVRDFYRCHSCNFIYVPPDQFLSLDEEKAYYDLHQNNPENVGYRQFLKKLFTPMINLLHPGSQGLDYGSGPGPTLSLMFVEQGYAMDIYDYIYARNDEVFNWTYDFVTCTETIEHLRHPREELLNIWRLLKVDGYLGVMTGMVDSQPDFANWHYKNDPTHICFYSHATVDWLKNRFEAKQVYVEGNVTILQKLKTFTQ